MPSWPSGLVATGRSQTGDARSGYPGLTRDRVIEVDLPTVLEDRRVTQPADRAPARAPLRREQGESSTLVVLGGRRHRTGAPTGSMGSRTQPGTRMTDGPLMLDPMRGSMEGTIRG